MWWGLKHFFREYHGDLMVIFYLVGGLEHVFFPFSWEFHHPNWLSHHFSEGEGSTTNQPTIFTKHPVISVLWWLVGIPPTSYGILSGKHTKSYWTCQFIVDLPINSIVIFNSFLYVYQAGYHEIQRKNQRCQRLGLVSRWASQPSSFGLCEGKTILGDFETGWWFGTWMDYDFPFSWESHHPNWLICLYPLVI